MADVRSVPVASIASVAACAAVLAACATGPGSGGAPPRRDPGAGESGVAYVDDASCADCHAREHEAWSGSHHDLAMQEATAETVLGDFDGATFTHFGVTSRFFMRETAGSSSTRRGRTGDSPTSSWPMPSASSRSSSTWRRFPTAASRA